MPFAIDVESALAHDAPVIWDRAPGNVIVDTWFDDTAATDRAFATADHVVKMDFHIGRVSPAPREPRAGLAQYDTASGRYTLYLCSGGPGIVRQKRDFAAVLGIPPDQLRLVARDTGGSFGAKNCPYVEFGLIRWVAKKSAAGQIYGLAIGINDKRVPGPRSQDEARTSTHCGRQVPCATRQ